LNLAWLVPTYFAMDRVELPFATIAVLGFALLGAALLLM
jgi:hypothetical protein